MKEQRITIRIDREGGITADAEGFSGDTCLTDLERLLEGLGAEPAMVERKPDTKTGKVRTTRTQTLGKKS